MLKDPFNRDLWLNILKYFASGQKDLVPMQLTSTCNLLIRCWSVQAMWRHVCLLSPEVCSSLIEICPRGGGGCVWGRLTKYICYKKWTTCLHFDQHQKSKQTAPNDWEVLWYKNQKHILKEVQKSWQKLTNINRSWKTFKNVKFD